MGGVSSRDALSDAGRLSSHPYTIGVWSRRLWRSHVERSAVRRFMPQPMGGIFWRGSFWCGGLSDRTKTCPNFLVKFKRRIVFALAKFDRIFAGFIAPDLRGWPVHYVHHCEIMVAMSPHLVFICTRAVTAFAICSKLARGEGAS